jgi:hypothetical protein
MNLIAYEWEFMSFIGILRKLEWLGGDSNCIYHLDPFGDSANGI